MLLNDVRDILPREDILDISHTSRVIADFVSNFVAMATWVRPFKFV